MRPAVSYQSVAWFYLSHAWCVALEKLLASGWRRALVGIESHLLCPITLPETSRLEDLFGVIFFVQKKSNPDTSRATRPPSVPKILALLHHASTRPLTIPDV